MSGQRLITSNCVAEAGDADYENSYQADTGDSAASALMTAVGSTTAHRVGQQSAANSTGGCNCLLESFGWREVDIIQVLHFERFRRRGANVPTKNTRIG